MALLVLVHVVLAIRQFLVRIHSILEWLAAHKFWVCTVNEQQIIHTLWAQLIPARSVYELFSAKHTFCVSFSSCGLAESAPHNRKAGQKKHGCIPVVPGPGMVSRKEFYLGISLHQVIVELQFALGNKSINILAVLKGPAFKLFPRYEVFTDEGIHFMDSPLRNIKGNSCCIFKYK